MDFHYTVTTNKSINEALRVLEQNLREHNYGILWQLDLPAKLREKGVDGYKNPFQVLEVCNPSEAARVISRNELVGYFLPCKITVYESNGKTKIGLPKPTYLVHALDDADLMEIAQQIEETLIRVIDQSM
ncbi:DUF302 domain-containing protein [Brevibacillus panacihumi]|uniref:DUF302 domain-containing protein n=1 Tax=Brevibacillus panacihumi TaxID=497735 RepID=UPI003D006B62